MHTVRQINLLVRPAVVQPQAFDGRTLVDVVAQVDFSAADPLAIAVLLALGGGVKFNLHFEGLFLVNFLASLFDALELAFAKEFNAFFDCVGNVEDAMSFVAVEVNESLDFILVKSFMFVGA